MTSASRRTNPPRSLLLLAVVLAAVRSGPALAADGPSVVKIVRDGDAFRLTRDGEPYVIRGAVLGEPAPETVARAGGNSIRAGARHLDDAHAAGLTVLVNLPLGLPRAGFDYSDPDQVARQLEATRRRVLAAKDHPAVLMWALGNELEIHTNEAQRVAIHRAINDLARMIHEVDPNHPVITVTGGQYRQTLREMQEQCPDLDAIGLNAYADMLTMPEDVARNGWDRPYVVTEFGPRGHWQSPRTPWGVPIEQTSTEKADDYRAAYEHAVADRPNCLGSYVFYWSQKQEKTHTWYGLFLPDGSRTAAIDEMTRLWTGHWPENRCPRIEGGTEAIRVEVASGRAGDEPGVFAVRTAMRCRVEASDPDGDPVRITWDLRPDVADNPNVGGDYEPSVEPIANAEGAEAVLTLPEAPGKYRIFVYAHDGRGSAATANRPILVVP